MTAGPEWTTVNQPPRIARGTLTPAWTAPPPAGRESLSIPQCDTGAGSQAIPGAESLCSQRFNSIV
ncbi:hypothetical protein [Saccharothrix luteola]|uniref:hypothetical protein n=1 Tax=Saccharothrix luteola TaxID=2893018 RepID=UPI001E294F7A|nr:hypothetical protein [Saccharothrix luteola]MCC8247758.1 hypothetical protein [Saccharothrix luteola]